jgi:hypothetical protein
LRHGGSVRFFKHRPSGNIIKQGLLFLFFSFFLPSSPQNKTPHIMFAATRAFAAKRAFSTSAANLSKVAVLGAAGGIGQPLSLLLKENPHVTHLSLYDIVNTPGVAADLR